MTGQTYSINFDGYWREINKGGVPAKSGIYCVYSCTYDQKEKNLNLKKLLYIGVSDDVRVRISKHEKQSDWEAHLRKNEVLCYSFGDVSSSVRDRCEASMIFKHKPPENTEYVDSLPPEFKPTTLTISGTSRFLENNFTVL